MAVELNQLLKLAVDRGASDLHLKAGGHPTARIHGQLTPVAEDVKLDPDVLVEMAATVLPATHRQRLKDSLEVDLA